MIVVIDTSVWISAMHYEKRRSKPVLALQRAVEQDVIATCAEIREEVRRVLFEKFNWDSLEIRRRLDFLLAQSVEVTITGKLHVCRDPNDDMILECALLVKADAIVSGDKDLLVLGSYEGIRILTAAEYLALPQ
jgi:uncharacterized protein